MPVRIYDIAKQLGLENKDVLIKAKELGISAAKVPSSSLDKITAEFLVEQLGGMRAQPRFAPPRIVLPPVLLVSEPPPTTAEASKPVISPGSETPGREFERRVRKAIEQANPFCVLPNVLLFHAEKARFEVPEGEQHFASDYAFEVDILLHQASAEVDNLIVIECKNQPITVRNEGNWEVSYPHQGHPERRKVRNVQEQLQRHAAALSFYVNPLSRGRRLHIDAMVVSSVDSTTPAVRVINPALKLHLVNLQSLLQALRQLKVRPLRIVQSDLLSILRYGIPVPELGHPEITNALAYIDRCRRCIDSELFRAFSPTKERWAINGSAGMGKSVLLAYALFVLTTDRKVVIRDGNKTLERFTEASELGVPPLGHRGVYAFAMKDKQRLVLENLYRRFVEEFSPLAGGADLSVRRPPIAVWNNRIPHDCRVLLLDEAHDLSGAGAKVLSAWVNSQENTQYLMLACDRHQKLRLVGRDESIVEGINFSLRTKKLRLNYRNPFPIYVTSLGLMFRWFATDGPKVIPTKDDLENGFGLHVVHSKPQGGATLVMTNDSHPANSWSHAVSVYPTCEAAMARLRPYRLQDKDVLWVRFADEDSDFDYEQLNQFTYHNFNSEESIELADKYVKGQDFPIVVIEGFPEDANQWSAPEHEQRMWQRRREIYVCTSRATAFLLLIPNGQKDEKFLHEVARLERQLSSPMRDSNGFSRRWRFEIEPCQERRSMDVFSDLRDAPTTVVAP